MSLNTFSLFAQNMGVASFQFRVRGRGRKVKGMVDTDYKAVHEQLGFAGIAACLTHTFDPHLLIHTLSMYCRAIW